MEPWRLCPGVWRKRNFSGSFPARGLAPLSREFSTVSRSDRAALKVRTPPWNGEWLLKVRWFFWTELVQLKRPVRFWSNFGSLRSEGRSRGGEFTYRTPVVVFPASGSFMFYWKVNVCGSAEPLLSESRRRFAPPGGSAGGEPGLTTLCYVTRRNRSLKTPWGWGGRSSDLLLLLVGGSAAEIRTISQKISCRTGSVGVFEVSFHLTWHRCACVEHKLCVCSNRNQKTRVLQSSITQRRSWMLVRDAAAEAQQDSGRTRVQTQSPRGSWRLTCRNKC